MLGTVLDEDAEWRAFIALTGLEGWVARADLAKFLREHGPTWFAARLANQLRVLEEQPATKASEVAP